MRAVATLLCIVWPCCSAVTYDDCRRACGDLAVLDFRPGFRTLQAACVCAKPSSPLPP